MDEPLFLKSSIESLLACLSGEEPEGTRIYPRTADRASLRISENEPVHHWFNRCVEAFSRPDYPLESWQIEPDLAVVAVLEWGDPGKRLLGCSMSVVKSNASLIDYCVDETVGAYYFRFDFDYGTLGPMFTHPLPHLHAWSSDAAPRFTAEGSGENIVVDFLEWICRHYYHEEWLLWVESICEPYFAKHFVPEKNPLALILRAFRESQMPVLREYVREVQIIKELLGEKKNAAFDLRVSGEDRRLLAYP